MSEKEIKFVSLDDKRTTVEIQINGEKFAINRLTLKGAELVKRYQLAASHAAYKAQEFQARLQEMGMKGSADDIYDKLSSATDAFIKEAERAETEIREKAQEAIKKILEDNGYKYEKSFWEEVDSTAPGDFIETVIKKDAPEKGAKKGAAEK